MTSPDDQLAYVRARFNEAIQKAYNAYVDAEELAAFLVMEIRRLNRASPDKSTERKERLDEKTELLQRAKQDMMFILDKIDLLVEERNEQLSDIHTSRRLADLSMKMDDLVPWVNDLSIDVSERTTEVMREAKISLELSQALNR
jgi:Glu-tRNA(Gln) amidotransferase subunit E-like FAD-binding protein